jgi:hypothetical protein
LLRLVFARKATNLRGQSVDKRFVEALPSNHHHLFTCT